MESLDQIQHTKSYSDVDSRRLKNRERQRRYRARKRLEAHTKQASVTKISTQLQAEKQLNGNFTNCVTHVHCKRNWKKDARMAHMLKSQAILSHGPVISAPTLTNDKVTCMPSGVTAEPLVESNPHYNNSPSLENLETSRTTHGRRDWKADARKKNKCV